MSFLLDTDICSAFMKGSHRVWLRFMQYSGRLHVSTITAGELFTWVLRANSAAAKQQMLLDLLDDLKILEVTVDVSRQFGELRALHLDKGLVSPQLDMFVAATALVHGLTLVTHNVQDFVNVPGLTIEDWLAP